eukprot:jgi/Botrbrau1/13342/Bobra.0334s0018.1
MWRRARRGLCYVLLLPLAYTISLYTGDSTANASSPTLGTIQVTCTAWGMGCGQSHIPVALRNPDSLVAIQNKNDSYGSGDSIPDFNRLSKEERGGERLLSGPIASLPPTQTFVQGDLAADPREVAFSRQLTTGSNTGRSQEGVEAPGASGGWADGVERMESALTDEDTLTQTILAHGRQLQRTWALPQHAFGDVWLKYHLRLVEEIKDADLKGGWEVVLYGDSVLEGFRGTRIGLPYPEFYEGVEKVWDKYFASKFRAHVLAVAGDWVSHLMWRLQNKGIPSAHAPRVVVLQIGTNDVSSFASCSPPAVCQASFQDTQDRGPYKEEDAHLALDLAGYSA